MNTAPACLRDIQYIIIDVDGVLWHGHDELPGVSDFFAFLRAHRIRSVIATNNSARPVSEILHRLMQIGVRYPEENILTSAEATAMYMPQLAPQGSRVFLVGGTGIAGALQRAGYVLVDSGADVVVAGVDFDLTYAKLKNATLEIRRGAKFVGTNSDRTFPGSEGLIPGAGAILAALEAATDSHPIVIGKPERAMFDMAVQKMHADRARTVVIGDRLDTDIAGAERAGLASILLLTGVTNQATLSGSAIRPTFVFKDLPTLQQNWSKPMPTY